ncbi:hypothetical protein EDD18DRAFT_1350743 [Armillaria luteobubalina]|uniref:Ndc10 domain-containing protein n=1 Tax=Armillaria luteobubalina TaxID=153913 RepID=A0AA39Q8X5_9AGAR|nr:hypothetical protein EDD18DRAFT_1350743 [Armillaria luteobubalina]
MPKKWVTKEQDQWFSVRRAAYNQARLDDQVGEYMKKVTKEFNEKWAHPGYEEVTGDSPEATAKRAAQDELFQVQKKKFNNERYKATVAAVTNNLVSNLAVLMKKKKLLFNLKPVQQLHAVQIYSQRYFPTHVWPYVNQALRANMQPLGHGAKLNLSNRITAKQFEAETDAIKEEILAAMEGVHEEISEAEAKRSPADYLEAIDQVPALLQCLLREIAAQTGWWFSVITGGPLLTDNGNIHTHSFHIGETIHGHNFLDEYAAFSMDPDDPATPQMRAQRALSQGQLNLLNDTTNYEGQAGLSMPPLSPSPMLFPAPPAYPLPPTSPLPPAFLLAPASPSLVASTLPAAALRLSPGVPVTPSSPSLSTILNPMMSEVFPSVLFPSAVFLPTSPVFPPPLEPTAPFDKHLVDDFNFFLSSLQQRHMEDPHLPQNWLPLLPNPHNKAELEDEVEGEGGPGAPFIEEGAGASSNEGSMAAAAHVSAIRGAKQKQDHIEDNDNGVHSEVRVSKRTRKPCGPRGIVATGWLPSALGYLMDPALGSEWQELLVKWQDLEGRMSQVAGHSPGKGHMGALSSRPSALSLWLTNRCYNIYPNPPVGFSTELCKWWNAMQPIWHQNKAGILPLPVYDRLLQKNLRKGGQNGMVTVLIGLMWWGQGTLEVEDRVLWMEMVVDVDKCIQTRKFLEKVEGRGGHYRKQWGDGHDDEQGIR